MSCLFVGAEQNREEKKKTRVWGELRSFMWKMQTLVVNRGPYANYEEVAQRSSSFLRLVFQAISILLFHLLLVPFSS